MYVDGEVGRNERKMIFCIMSLLTWQSHNDNSTIETS